MYDIAKSARAALKSKARRLAEEKEEKVTSADWSPSEPLNADVKTGARPLKRRTYKTGGKVSGECGPMRADRKPRKSGGRALTANSLVNRDVREANEEREGVKHVGAFKKGGRVKKEEGGSIESMIANMDKAEGKVDLPKRGPMPPQRPVDRTPAVKVDPKQQIPGDHPTNASGYSAPRKAGGRAKKMMGGPLMSGQMPGGTMMGATSVPVSQPDERQNMVRPTRMQFTGAQGTPYKKGGKVSHMEWEHSKKDLEQDKKLAKKHGMSLEQWEKSAADKKHDKQQSMKGLDKSKKAGGGMIEASKKAMMVAKDPHNQAKIKPQQPQPKPEDERVARKSGGRTKGKSRTNIAIVINAGKKDQDQDMPMPMPGGRAPLPGAPRAAAAPAPGMMPPMAAGLGGAGAPPPGAMPPPGMPPMPRKAGGRVYKSALDMDAGAGSGVGRLEKTEIASRQPKPGLKRGVIVDDNKGYPNKVNGATGGRTAKKAGGKVYRSYKDMDAGAGSGMGRLEKTEIESRKSVR